MPRQAKEKTRFVAAHGEVAVEDNVGEEVHSLRRG